jgi:AcrR family transcriptional regulator
MTRRPPGAIDAAVKRAAVSPAIERKRKGSYHHGNLRRAMVNAAIRLIASKGSDAFTLREVARLVGVTHRAAYRHFADKTALLAEVSEDGWRTIIARVERVKAADATPIERVAAMIREYIQFAFEHPSHYRVMAGPRLNESGRFPSLEATGIRAMRLLGSVVEEAFPGDERRAELAFALFLMTNGYCDWLVTGRMNPRSTSEAVAGFAPLMSRLLGAGPPGRPTR